MQIEQIDAYAEHSGLHLVTVQKTESKRHTESSRTIKNLLANQGQGGNERNNHSRRDVWPWPRLLEMSGWIASCYFVNKR